VWWFASSRACAAGRGHAGRGRRTRGSTGRSVAN
jgi:hypothetical protein